MLAFALTFLLLLAETVREAIAEGATEYDLLLGGEAFKLRFATGKRLGRSVLLAPPISRKRLAATAKGLAGSGARAMPAGAARAIRRRSTTCSSASAARTSARPRSASR